MGLLTLARTLRCSQFRREGTKAGCEDYQKYGQCRSTPKKLYKDASRWLCGFWADRGYRMGCDPKLQKTLLGANRCKILRTTQRRRRTQRR